MIVLKKRNLAILLIIALCSGLVMMAAYDQVYEIVTDQIRLSAAEYEDYKRLKNNYGQLDELQQLIEQKYYIPVDSNKLYEGLYKGLLQA